MSKASKPAAVVGDWENGRFVFPLEKPVPDIENPGEFLKEVTLREPSGTDMVEAGNPVDFDPISQPPKVSIDPRKMAAMISRLSALPPSVVGRMAPKDMINIGWVVAPFFVPV